MVETEVRAPEGLPRRFWLRRDTDPTGVSGVGIVAQGSQWTTGAVALYWPGPEVQSTVVYASLDDMLFVHNHMGAGTTSVLWIDDEDGVAVRRDHAECSA